VIGFVVERGKRKQQEQAGTETQLGEEEEQTHSLPIRSEDYQDHPLELVVVVGVVGTAKLFGFAGEEM